MGSRRCHEPTWEPLGHFGITLESLLAYEGHFGSLWGDFGTILRFLLAIGGDFEATLGSLLAYGGTFGMLLGQFGTTLRFLLAGECDFGVALEHFGVTFVRVLRSLGGNLRSLQALVDDLGVTSGI